MSVVTLDAMHSALLRDQLQPVLIQDESGRVLGRFIPQLDSEIRKRLTPPPLSDVELQRRLNEPSYTTAEVLAYLEGLDV